MTFVPLEKNICYLFDSWLYQNNENTIEKKLNYLAFNVSCLRVS